MQTCHSQMFYTGPICISNVMWHCLCTPRVLNHFHASHYGNDARVRLSATSREPHGRRPALNPDSRWQQPKKPDPVGFITTQSLSVVQQHSHRRQRWFERRQMKQKRRQLLFSSFTRRLCSAPGDSTFWNHHGRQIQFILKQQGGESGWE